MATPIKLTDLGAEVVDVTVNTTYGRAITLPIRLLTWHEWNEIGAAVREPSIPNTRLGVNGEKLPNPTDTKYQLEAAAAQEERQLQRLAKALTGGGNEIPGADLEEQAQALRETLETGIASALLNVISDAAFKGKARIIERADSFPAE